MRRLRRIAFHLVAFLSALPLIAALVMAFRSRGRYEAWIVAPQNAPLPPGHAQWKQTYMAWESANNINRAGPSMMDHTFWIIDRRIISTGGTLIMYRQHMIPIGGKPNPNTTPGYHQMFLRRPAGAFILRKMGTAGEHYVSLPGLHFVNRPASMTISPLRPAPSTTRSPAFIGGPSLAPGTTELAISWWWIALAAGILPVIWIVKMIHRLRTRAANPNACPACGYDIRATPHRCPECGAAPNEEQAQVTHLISS